MRQVWQCEHCNETNEDSEPDVPAYLTDEMLDDIMLRKEDLLETFADGVDEYCERVCGKVYKDGCLHTCPIFVASKKADALCDKLIKDYPDFFTTDERGLDRKAKGE